MSKNKSRDGGRGETEDQGDEGVPMTPAEHAAARQQPEEGGVIITPPEGGDEDEDEDEENDTDSE